MTIEAELHDGTVLEFPDGTAPDVVQGTVKRYLGKAPESTSTKLGDWARRARPRFQGIPVEEQAKGPRFSGIPVTDDQATTAAPVEQSQPEPTQLGQWAADQMGADVTRPASMTLSRTGRRTFVDMPTPPPEEPSAPWTGPGGMATALAEAPAASTRASLANLRHLFAEGNVAGREEVLAPGTNPLGYNIRPKAIARQQEALAADRAASATAAEDVTAANQDLAAITPENMSTWQKALFSTAASAPPTLLGIATGILTKNPALAMTIAGGGGAAMQGGQTYGEAREKGAPHLEAARAAGIDAILEGAGEALPLKLALKPGTAIAKRIANTLVAEAGQEGATQAAQDLHAFLTYNPDITLKEAWENLKVAALAGAAGGAVYGAAGHAAARSAAAPAAAAEEVPLERRRPAASDLRTRVADMQPEEMRQALLTDHMTGLQNRRAYDEAEKLPAQVSIDLDALKWMNDNLGHGAGDELIRRMGNAIAEEIKDAGAGYHLSGDEFAIQAGSHEEAESIMRRVHDRLSRAELTFELPDGRTVTKKGVDFSHGIGPTLEEADNALRAHKTARETAGQRAPRGEVPQGIAFGPTQGEQAGQSLAPAEAETVAAAGTTAAATLPEASPAGTVARTSGALGMPAGVTVAPAVAGGAQPPAWTTAAPSANARPDAIRAEVQKLFETVISEKHQGRKNLGIYKIKPQVIRVRNRNDLRTISHEVGHHISNLNQNFRLTMAKHGNELYAMAPAAYHQQKHTRKFMVEEGFAEFIAEYLTDRPTAQAKAPGFYKDFQAWLGQNPRYFDAIKQVSDAIGAHQALSPEDRILAKVGAYTPPWAERLGEVVSKDTWDAFAQATLDKWHPVKAMVADLMPGVAASKNPYIAARLLAGDAAVVEDWISKETTPFDYAKRLDPKNYGKPLKAILDPILTQGEETVKRFKAYLIARRAAELKVAGKENLFEAREIAQGLALQTPQFKQVAAEVYKYNDQLLDYAVEGGLLSQESADKFRQYGSYIPFFREAESEGKPGGRGEPFKKLTGGTANLRDPIANLIQSTASIIHATNRNAAVQKAAALARAVPGGGKWLEDVPLSTAVQKVATQRIMDQLRAQGVVIDTSMAEDLATMQVFFSKAAKSDERTRTIVYKQAGEPKALQVNDPLLWKALGNIPPLEMGLFWKMLAAPAQTLRAGVVLDPTFMARNFIRDTLSATLQSKGAFLPVAGTVQGIKMMAQNDDAYRLFRAFGGAFADQFREPEEAAKIVQKMAQRGGFSPQSILHPGRILDILKKAGSYSESGSRVGEFAATYKPGDIDSAIQAALNAREVSTDFGMRGGANWIQILTRLTPFMNPTMQGLYKGARVLSGEDGRAVQMKAATLGSAMALASVALALMNSDDDWYKRLEEWEKVTYWHFKIGGEIYRMPKPYEYGGLFASIPEAIALRQQGKEGWEDFKKRMLQVLGQVLLFRVIPQSAVIPAEPWANKSMFTGRPIVPDKEKNLEPGLQATPGTSKTAQLAGEAANVSPAVIDNVVRNTLGTLGMHAILASDAMLEATGAAPKGRERTWRSWPVVKAFVHDPDNPNSKQLNDFYDDLEKYRRALATMKEYDKRGQEAKATSYMEKKQFEIDAAKSAERMARTLTAARRLVAELERAPDMSPREKREKINEVNADAQAAVEAFQAGARQARQEMQAQ